MLNAALLPLLKRFFDEVRPATVPLLLGLVGEHLRRHLLDTVRTLRRQPLTHSFAGGSAAETIGLAFCSGCPEQLTSW